MAFYCPRCPDQWWSVTGTSQQFHFISNISDYDKTLCCPDRTWSSTSVMMWCQTILSKIFCSRISRRCLICFLFKIFSTPETPQAPSQIWERSDFVTSHRVWTSMTKFQFWKPSRFTFRNMNIMTAQLQTVKWTQPHWRHLLVWKASRLARCHLDYFSTWDERQYGHFSVELI